MTLLLGVSNSYSNRIRFFESLTSFFIIGVSENKAILDDSKNDGNKKEIDVKQLKHFLHRANLHRTNPPLFKRINDYVCDMEKLKALKQDFKETWKLEEMEDFFLKSAFNDLIDFEEKCGKDAIPSLDQIVGLFEQLDTHMNEYLTVKDMEIFLKNFLKFKLES